MVGASWGGVDFQDQKWVKRGIWILGFQSGPQKKRAKQMEVGDRIAIKRNSGGKNPDGSITILHLGIITDVKVVEKRVMCDVTWVTTDLDRAIPDGKGCYQSVHGPFKNDAWVRKVFCL